MSCNCIKAILAQCSHRKSIGGKSIMQWTLPPAVTSSCDWMGPVASLTLQLVMKDKRGLDGGSGECLHNYSHTTV